MITWWVELEEVEACFVDNEKKKRESQHLSEGGIEKAESGFPRAGGSWPGSSRDPLAVGAVCQEHFHTSALCWHGPEGCRVHLTERVCTAYLCSPTHSPVQSTGLLSWNLSLSCFNFSFCFFSSSTDL